MGLGSNSSPDTGHGMRTRLAQIGGGSKDGEQVNSLWKEEKRPSHGTHTPIVLLRFNKPSVSPSLQQGQQTTLENC